MNRSPRFCCIIALILALCAPPMAARADALARADAAWSEGSYAIAEPLYQEALRAGTARDKDEIEYRIAVCLGKTEQWDRALDAGKALVQTSPSQARALYWLGRLYTQVPHSGYEVGGKVYRGQDYPKTTLAEEPRQVYLANDDAAAAVNNLESAKIAAQRERHGSAAAPTLSWTEEIDLNFDLAALLAKTQYSGFVADVRAGRNLNETVDPASPYDRGWSLPRKAIYLYEEIAKLDRSPTRHQSALASLGKGLFAQSYRRAMDGWANHYDPALQKSVKVGYPFDWLDPVDTWIALIERFPDDPIAPGTQILIAREWQERDDSVKALAAYRLVAEKYPDSKWVSDARGAIDGITHRELSFDTMGQQLPGKAARLTVQTRNVRTVDLAAYRVKLEDLLASPGNLNAPDRHFTEFCANSDALSSAPLLAGNPVARWSFDTRDRGDYRAVNETIDTPLHDVGAYVVVARSGALKYESLLVISDLAIVTKCDRDRCFAYIADALTGKPVSGAHVVVKETYSRDNDSRRHVEIARGASSAQGFFDKARESDSSNLEALAWLGDRYTFTGAAYSGGGADSDERLRIYGYTDRPVYRPAQIVFFRQILTQRIKGGDQLPARNCLVHVTISNPKGETIYDKTLTSSEFGTVNGRLTLPADTPLGEYSIEAGVSNGQGAVDGSGGSRFRVEEYKRPEFEVTVDTPSAPVRPGDSVTARLNATYYFGAPVQNATVKYTVRRGTWWPYHRFPQPFAWLYDSWDIDSDGYGRRNIGGQGSGAILKEGTAITDDLGNATVVFKASAEPDSPAGPEWMQRPCPLYTVEAEVTDASRRTIEGQGVIKGSRQPYFAYLHTQCGYYLQGDRIPIEVETRDANDTAVTATGKMVVYKLLPGDIEKKLLEEPVQTDARGRAFWTWPSDEAGQFRIAYEATGAWGDKIVGSTPVWVGGPGLDRTQIRLRGVTIVLEKRYYQEGDTLKALLIADSPDSVVVLTQETGNQILDRQLVFIPGKSREITIPISHRHVPNFSLAAALVKNYQVYSCREDVFVPPVRSLIQISVHGNKPTYKPGEKGTFSIAATDWQGKPARAEVSVALIDASLFYIQADYAPAIATFFYGDRRYDSVTLDSQLSGISRGCLEDDQRVVDYPQHNWELPDGMGLLDLTPGFIYGFWPVDGRFGSARGAMMAPVMLRATDAAAEVGMVPMAKMGMMNQAAAPSSAAPTALAPAAVRNNFAETAFWSPAVVTERGKATVQVTFPDSLTRWHATVRGVTGLAEVGASETDVETKKNLLVRLQAPRFFAQRDRVVLTANVQNYLPTDERVKVSLQIGDELRLLPFDKESSALATGANLSASSGFVKVKSAAQARVNWLVEAVRDGPVKIRMTAQTQRESDAVEMSFPVLVHGVRRFAAQSGVLRGQDTATTAIFTFPQQRRAGSSSLNVQLNPSLAATMLDALPYLADYPYGCVEQTMSRFLPSVVAAKALSDSGIDLAALRRRAQAYAGESKAKPAGQAVANSGYTYPAGMPDSRDLSEMASRLWYTARRGSANPIFDADAMHRAIDEGLQRLYGMQRSDGGWGWWPGSSASDAYMSAYVVYGLATARAAEVPVRAQALESGFDYLQKQMMEQDNLHLLTCIAYSLSLRGTASPTVEGIVSGRLFQQRERLTPYSQSLLAMALWNFGDRARARVVVRNLENTVKIDAANGTAHWQMDSQWWCWWNNDIETNAAALRAFLSVQPSNKLTPMLMKWLTARARGAHWSSTHETAMAVYALADYIRVNKEFDVDYAVTVKLDNRVRRTYHVTTQNALYFDNRFVVGDPLLHDGANTLSITKRGRGNLYWNASAEYFSMQEPIVASGHELSIQRRYFKLTRNPAVIAEQGSGAPPTPSRTMGPKMGFIIPRPEQPPGPAEYVRTEIKDGSMLKSGDLVEVELVIDAANAYQYVVFEDMKPAGLEAVDLRSGTAWGDGLCSNVELRDGKVAFFVDWLPQGTRVLRYRLRAEIPGRFHALPTNGYAMYAPEVRAISNELRVGVEDR